ncbi:MAG: TrpB-like pyridoxal phosphate-dependent enzyme [Spirochaetia bacterium]|jgi:pyridoxal-phosphate dependent TrpB-like enzyme
MTDDRIFQLPTREIPKKWLNIQPALPEPVPPMLDPSNGKPVPLEAFTPLFPMGLLEQEVSQQREITIPDEVLKVYSMFRPTPLIRAKFLEEALGTPAMIFFKNESVTPTGSHKPNTAIPQAYYNKREGVKKLATETGAGQWGSALAFAGAHFNLDINVFMVRASYEQKPYRKVVMQSYGAKVHPSPSQETQIGKKMLEDKRNYPGSLGIAISEAVEIAATSGGTVKYSLGSVLNHVLLHQTVIGQEAKAVLEDLGLSPDIVIACHGGGSNFGGIAIPFMEDKISGKKKIEFIASEPLACPSLSKGIYAYDFGDAGKLIPLAKMYTLGHGFIPPSVHAGGLRYHGASPIVSVLNHLGLIRAEALRQKETFEAAVLFARTEGIIPAPESAHAIASAIRAAKKCKETGEKKVILFNLSGHGHFDMYAYEQYFAGKLEDYEYPEEAILKAEKDLPKVG